MESTYSQLGAMIEAGRLVKGFASQKALADVLHVTQQSVSRWEAGTHRPQLAQLQIIARVLDLSLPDLMRSAGYETTAGAAWVKPLPVDKLDPETFEAFTADLVSEIETDAQVQRLGKTGHAQGGFDVVAIRRTDGRARRYQCKRVAQFGPAQVDKAVKAGAGEGGEKVLVLSRVASPETARAIDLHPDWTLWDRDGINLRFRKLSPNVQERIVDTYFRGQELELLGRPRAGAWLNADEFFRPFLRAGGLFTHDWTLLGREVELVALREAAADVANPFTLLIAPGGMGKSRLLREAAVRSGLGAGRVWFLSGAAEIVRADLVGLGPGPKLLVVDDAHDREALGILFEHAADPANQARLLLAARPYAETRLRQEAAVTGLEPRVVRLGLLPTATLEDLARDMLRKLDAPEEWAEDIVSISGGSPLILSMASRVLAEEAMEPERIRGLGTLKDFVLGKFTGVVTGRLGPGVDPATHLKVLEILALTQPFHPEDSQLLQLIETVQGVPVREAERAMRTLIEGGVVLRRGSHHRLMPDVLGDYLIDKVCLTVGGSLSDFARATLDAAPPRLLGAIFTNLGRLDWRRTDGETGDSRLLDEVWRGLRDITNDYDERLEAVRTVALFQPRQALDFVAHLVRIGLGSRVAPDILRNIALASEHRREALELLWALASQDDRDTGPNPSHPVRVMTELASFRDRKAPELYDDILAFIMDLMDRPDAWDGPYSPVNLISPFLATEGTNDRYDGRAVTISPFQLRYDFIRPYREAVIDKLFALLQRPEPKVSRRAALAFSEALQSPIGLMGLQTSAEADALYDAEFNRTLGRMREAVEAGLPHATSIALMTAIDWHVDYGGATREAARAVVAALPDTLDFRLSAALSDGFGNTFLDRRDAENWSDNLDCWMKQTAAELRATVPHAKERRGRIEAALVALRAAGDELTAAHSLVHAAVVDDPDMARELVEDAETRPDSATARYAAIALGALHADDPPAVRERLRRWLAGNRPDLRRAAPLVVFGSLPAFGPDDIALVREMLSHPDDDVVFNALRAVWSWRTLEADAQLALIFQTRFGDPRVLNQAAMMLGGVRSDLTGRLTRAQALRFLEAAEPLEKIDDHWTNEVIAVLSRLYPRETAAFFRRRVERSESAPYQIRVANHGPYVRASLQFQKADEGDAVLFETWTWLRDNWDRGPDFHHGAYQLFEAMFLGDETWLVGFFGPLLAQSGRAELDLIGNLLRHAHFGFVLRQPEFVIRFLERCAAVDLELAREAGMDLYSGASSGMWTGVPGQPTQRDENTLEQTTTILKSLSRISPAYELYDRLRRLSVRNIEESRREGEIMEEL